jgi:hypothetical protein
MKLGLLRHRDYRLYWIGETVSTVGSAMAVVAMPLTAVLVLHAGAFEVGMLQATAWLPSLLIGLVAGAWVDRMRKRAVMVVADVVSLVLFASVPVVAWACPRYPCRHRDERLRRARRRRGNRRNT